MKIPITIKAAVLALAGFVLGALPASALSYSDGDILVGFRSSNTVYLVNLGSVSQLTGAAPGSTLSFGNFATDLVATFGANWADQSALSWGFFGADEAANYTLYASRSRTNLANQSVPWAALNIGNRTATDSQIDSVTSGFLNVTTTTASTNVANGGFQSATTQGTYYYAVTTGNSDFGSVSGWSSIEGSNASGIDNTILDFVKVGATGSGAFPSSVVGNFTIDSAGTISFNAVPEPSTYALLIISGVAMVVFLRRRAAKQS